MTFKEWEDSFLQVTGNITDGGYIAALQRTIGSQADCLILVGGGTFRLGAISEYVHSHLKVSDHCYKFLAMAAGYRSLYKQAVKNLTFIAPDLTWYDARQYFTCTRHAIGVWCTVFQLTSTKACIDIEVLLLISLPSLSFSLLLSPTSFPPSSSLPTFSPLHFPLSFLSSLYTPPSSFSPSLPPSLHPSLTSLYSSLSSFNSSSSALSSPKPFNDDTAWLG